MDKTGLSHEEVEEYKAVCREAAALSKEVASLRDALKKAERAFSKACKKKWAFEERIAEVKVIPPGKSGLPRRGRPQLTKKEATASLKELVSLVNKGTISKEEFASKLNEII